MNSIINQSSQEDDIKNHTVMKRIPPNTLNSLPVPLQTTSHRLNELFLSLLQELNLKRLDLADLKMLRVFTEGYLLKNDGLLSTFSDDELLLQLEKLGGKNLRDAVEGLGLFLTDKQLNSLEELDLLLDKELELVRQKLPLLPETLLEEELNLKLDETL